MVVILECKMVERIILENQRAGYLIQKQKTQADIQNKLNPDIEGMFQKSCFEGNEPCEHQKIF